MNVTLGRPLATSHTLAVESSLPDASRLPSGAKLTEKNIATAEDLKTLPAKRSVLVAGVVVIRQRPMTAKGFVFITLEDETGFSNIVVKPNLMKRFRRVIIFSQALIVRGVLEKEEGVVNVIGYQFYPLGFQNREINIRSRDFR